MDPHITAPGGETGRWTSESKEEMHFSILHYSVLYHTVLQCTLIYKKIYSLLHFPWVR